ncbi:MAG: hypothetical protein GQ470_04760, partial [Gammaproteobacteria bacterium]|nr:hypothetical protein [Gammaproteobacteria bacterium]
MVAGEISNKYPAICPYPTIYLWIISMRSKMNIQTNYHTSPIKQLGFTLIEAMIAFAVAGVGILAVVSFQTELISTSSQSKAKAEALQYAQTKLEE